VCAIRHAAAGNVDVLRALLVNPDTAVAPVQDPDYANSPPLHVAIKEHCVSALEVLLPVYQIAAFSRVDGYNETAIRLAQRLAAHNPNGPHHLACGRALLVVAHFFLCAQIKHSDDITDDMRGIFDSPLTRGAVNDQFCSNQNQTLLHVAICAKRVEVVKFLLQRRACIHLKMHPPLGDPRTEGPSALEFAREMHRSNGGAEEQIHRLIMEVQDNPDVFISYRQVTEKDIALVMYQTLVGAPHFLNVFLDSSSDNGIPPGAKWQKYFVKLLSRSRVFVPIISYDGVLKRICSASSNPQSQHEDNVLLEHIVALALPAIKVVPLWIGPGCLSPPPSGCVASASYPWNDVVQLHRVLPQDIAAVEALHKNVPTIEAAQRICREVFPSASVAERELQEQLLLNVDVALGTVWAGLKSHNGFLFEDPALQQAVAAAAAGVAPAHARAQTLDTRNVQLRCQQIRDALVKHAVPSITYQPPPPLQMTRGGVLTILNAPFAKDIVAEAIFALSNFCAGLGFDSLVTSVHAGSVIIHFRLVITRHSHTTTLAGYDALERLHADGTMERQLGLGSVLFALEYCIDESLPMLLHQQRCNFEELNRQFGHVLGSVEFSELAAHTWKARTSFEAAFRAHINSHLYALASVERLPNMTLIAASKQSSQPITSDLMVKSSTRHTRHRHPKLDVSQAPPSPLQLPMNQKPKPTPAPSFPPPAIDFPTEWLDEHGRVCPKAVHWDRIIGDDEPSLVSSDGVTETRGMAKFLDAFTLGKFCILVG
jgi:hypothetical protein